MSTYFASGHLSRELLVHFVDAYALSLGFVDGLVEMSEQLSQSLSLMTNQHGQSLMAIMGGDRHTSSWTNNTERDLAMLDEFFDVAQGSRLGIGLCTIGLRPGSNSLNVAEGTKLQLPGFCFWCLRLGNCTKMETARFSVIDSSGPALIGA